MKRRAEKVITTEQRCPQCHWRPTARDVWKCSHCGHSWNTFQTRGVCPQCQYQWTITACLSCHQWSHHDDWYVKD